MAARHSIFPHFSSDRPVWEITGELQRISAKCNSVLIKTHKARILNPTPFLNEMVYTTFVFCFGNTLFNKNPRKN